MENNRIKITKFLQWNDRNGCYTDENCDLEDIPRMTWSYVNILDTKSQTFLCCTSS